MARYGNWSHCKISEPDGLTVHDDKVFFRPRLICRRILIRRGIWRIDEVPIGGSRSNSRVVTILEISGAAEMVRVSVAEKDVFDMGRNQTERQQTGDNSPLPSVRVSGVAQ